jgi:hypothetical protein
MFWENKFLSAQNSIPVLEMSGMKMKHRYFRKIKLSLWSSILASAAKQPLQSFLGEPSWFWARQAVCDLCWPCGFCWSSPVCRPSAARRSRVTSFPCLLVGGLLVEDLKSLLGDFNPWGQLGSFLGEGGRSHVQSPAGEPAPPSHAWGISARSHFQAAPRGRRMSLKGKHLGYFCSLLHTQRP